MAENSKARVEISSGTSSSGSDNLHDPDYSVRLSNRRMQWKKSTSFEDNNSSRNIGSSARRGQNGGRPQKRRRSSDADELGNSMQTRDGVAKTTRASRRRVRSTSRRRRQIVEATILSWLIDSKTIVENERVCYMDEAGESVRKEGKLSREGIVCCCCNEVCTVPEFEVHAAGSEIKRPYERILTMESRVSLLSCMMKAWNEPRESMNHQFNLIDNEGKASDWYDDACIICADGGNLMCCEKCNSTYHQACMGMEELPEDLWFCPYCVCILCGKTDFENSHSDSCSQCEKKYHWECLRSKDPMVIDLNSKPLSICGQSCKEVYEKLEKMMGVENEIEEDVTWTLLRHMDPEFGIYVDDEYNRTECHSKLAVAWRVMEECFETIVDRHTRIDVIQSVLYNCGSNFNRINFRGFYTFVLERKGEIISVASLRIHGTKIAEMPFIATREFYRCKGMCSKLMTAIESTLCYLKVENLIIPSTEEMIGKWIDRYGFRKIEDKTIKDIMQFNTLMFHDSIRLSKTLCASNEAEPDAEINEGVLQKLEKPEPFNLNAEPEPEERNKD